ncbi:nucleotidyl transferase AbiEii/AbiGii toxin family protein [Myroides odoratimimus]|uniref:nucleotidyl transferase AbiEii/AbiGii toxin family protein n=1 Tax=Myroides TaxID=76831 RepID=UPI0025755701|nr:MULTISPECIES: nucleotidyl transferase AbiEii/AbiGii toxin family protein [Myroides]MDM1328544.1 nucleotidyl transferase AbiEii/AbiGii toxin family protein [Myroides odoratimimus]MDM1467467.1 nucleotidyl transferase AbiEii/AbiGii toxin family protein [Myroides odoratimimus]MDM1470485.1 nucleotidyl transferase AbiEii/AbiGii toxin family protein [Myroides odoratimimus]MDM1480657.1 nucleotidyl transferase AbiEii/AbiGii toxin family protein [Myroides odoratimimus]MDM1497127.1 nucleotidyl transfe
MLHKDTVINELWDLLQKLMQDEKLQDFILVGGTALSLQIGHRISIDIDLFSTKDFDYKSISQHLKQKLNANVKEIFNNTILMDINRIKVDIIAHKYPLQKEVLHIDNVRLASLEDIGAMKLHAIFQSGTRIKDFVDMYFLLEHNPLQTYLDVYKNKYGGNIALASYALTFYENIYRDFEVTLMNGKESNWDRMKERLEKAVDNPSFKFDLESDIKKDQHIIKRGLRR